MLGVRGLGLSNVFRADGAWHITEEKRLEKRRERLDLRFELLTHIHMTESTQERTCDFRLLALGTVLSKFGTGYRKAVFSI